MTGSQNGGWRGKGTGGNSRAFTWIELIVVLGVAGLLLCLALPWLVASNKAKARLTQCQSNLKEITWAFHLWMEDQDAQRFDGPAFPWQFPRGEGEPGKAPEALRTNCWFQFTWLSNHIASPKVLADPADRRPGLQLATNWGNTAAGGFTHPAYQDNACSYGLAIDTGTRLNSAQNMILVTDRHLTNFVMDRSCKYKLGTLATFRNPGGAQYTREVHGTRQGVIGVMDGSVMVVSPGGFNQTLPLTEETPPQGFVRDPTNYGHFLFPALK